MNALQTAVARSVYSAFMQSPVARKFSRYAPLAATLIYVVVTALRLFGVAGSEAALETLRSLGIQPGGGISEAEIFALVGGAWGLYSKGSAMILQAKASTIIMPPHSGPVLKTEQQQDDWITIYQAARAQGLTFEEARKLALARVIAKHAPEAVAQQAQKVVEKVEEKISNGQG